MGRKELDLEVLESINGGDICAGYSATAGCNIAYLSQDMSTIYKLNVSLADWSYYCNTQACVLPTEETIMEAALKDGKVSIYLQR